MKERPEWDLEKVSPSQLFVRHQCKETAARRFPGKEERRTGCGKQVPAFWRFAALIAPFPSLSRREPPTG
jgi:hypothetical protein